MFKSLEIARNVSKMMTKTLKNMIRVIISLTMAKLKIKTSMIVSRSMLKLIKAKRWTNQVADS